MSDESHLLNADDVRTFAAVSEERVDTFRPPLLQNDLKAVSLRTIFARCFKMMYFYFILSLSSPAALLIGRHNRRTRRFRIAVCQQHVVLQRLHLRHEFIKSGRKIRGQRYIFRTNQLYVFRSQVILILRSRSSYRLRLFDLPTAGCVQAGKTIKLTAAIRLFSQGKYLDLVSGQAY